MASPSETRRAATRRVSGNIDFTSDNPELKPIRSLRQANWTGLRLGLAPAIAALFADLASAARITRMRVTRSAPDHALTNGADPLYVAVRVWEATP